jgi:hypothetical protein
MTNVTWKTGINADWSLGTDWSTGLVPGSNDDVSVDAGGSYTVTVTTPEAAHSVTLDATSGTLDVSAALNLGTSFALELGDLILASGGTLVGGSLVVTGGSVTAAGGELLGTAVTGNIAVGTGNLTLAGDITLNGTVAVGGANGTLVLAANPALPTATTITGGTIAVGNISGYAYIDTDNVNGVIFGAGLSVVQSERYAYIEDGAPGAGLENEGAITAGYFGGQFVIDQSAFTNDGQFTVQNGDTVTVNAGGGITNAAGGTITVNGKGSELVLNAGADALANDGSILVEFGGTLALSGTYTAADLGRITNKGGTLILAGTLENAGNTLTTTPDTGIELSDVAVVGGTIVNDGGLTLLNGTTLDGVTYIGPTLTPPNDAEIFLANNPVFLQSNGTTAGTLSITGYGDSIGIIGNNTIDHATINISNNYYYYGSDALEFYTTTGGSTPILTLGTAATLDLSGYYSDINGGGIIDNNGTVTISSPYQIYDYSPIVNNNVVTVSGGGGVHVEQFYNYATTTVTGSGTGLELGYDSTTWENAGTIIITNGASLYLDGALTTASASGIDNTGGTVFLNGAYNNVGGTLNADAGGPLGVLGLGSSGVVVGGSIQDTAGTMVFQGGTLAGVTYRGTLNLTQYSAVASLVDGTAGSFTAASGASPGTIDLTGENTYLRILDTETLDNLTINLSSSNNYYYYYSAIAEQYDDLLTFGPNAIINQTGNGAEISSPTTIDFQGTLNASDYEGSFYIYAQPLVNSGSILVSNYDRVYVEYGFSNTAAGLVSVTGNGLLSIGSQNDGDFWTNLGTMAVSNGGTLQLSGSFSVDSAGNITNDAGFVQITGVLENQGSVYTPGSDLVAGQITLVTGGVILGGTIDDPNNLLMFQGGSLAAVTDETNLEIGAGQSLEIETSITLTGIDPSIDVGGGGYQATLTFYQVPTLNGLSLNLSSNAYINFEGGAVTWGPNLTVRVGGTGETIYLQANTVANYGSLVAADPGGSLTINNYGFFDNYASILVASGATLAIDSVFGNDAGGNVLVTGAGSSLTLGSWYYPTVGDYYYENYVDGYTYLSDWSNAGTITVANGASLYLGGDFIDAALTTGIVNQGGTIFIKGVLNNTGETLTVGAGSSLPDVVLGGGEIVGGTVVATDGALLDGSGTLAGVTYVGDVTIGGSNTTITATNGLSVVGVAGPAITDLVGNNDTVAFAGTQTINNGIIELNNTDTLAAAEQFVQTYTYDYGPSGYTDYGYVDGSTAAGQLTLGSGSVVEQLGQAAGIVANGPEQNGDDFTNQGSVLAGYQGGEFVINAVTFTNDSTVLVSNGDTMWIASTDFNNDGTIIVTGAGSYLRLSEFNTDSVGEYNSGAQSSPGPILVGPGATIELDGSIADLASSVTLEGGTGLITGLFNDNGNTLDLPSGGELILGANGTIENTVIQDPPPGMLFAGGTLENVTYLGLLDLSEAGAAVSVVNALTVGTAAGASPGTIELTGDGATMTFYDSQTLDNVVVWLGGTNEAATLQQQDSYFYSGGGGSGGVGDFTPGAALSASDAVFGGGAPTNEYAGTLTLGPSLQVVQTGSLAILTTGDYGGDTLINQGAIDADIPGAALTIQGQTFTNQGLLSAGQGVIGAGGTLIVDVADFTNLNNGTLTGGTYDVQSGATLQIVSQSDDPITTLAADVTLDGQFTPDGANYYDPSLQVYNPNDGQTFDLLNSVQDIAAGSTLAIIDTQQAAFNLSFGGNAITVDGELVLGGPTFQPQPSQPGNPAGPQPINVYAAGITIDPSGTFLAAGYIYEPVEDNGQLQTNGYLALEQGASGTGTALINPGDSLELNGTLNPGVTFDGVGTLVLDDPTYLQSSISGLSLGDTFVFNNIGGINNATIDGSTLGVTIDGTGYTYDLAATANPDFYANVVNGNSVVIGSQSNVTLAIPDNIPGYVDLGNLLLGQSIETNPQTQYIIDDGSATEDLDVSVAFSTGNAYATGTITDLTPGNADYSDINIGLNPVQRGYDYGTVGLTFSSDGSVVGDGYGVTPLQTDTIGVWGTVYSLATYSVTAPGTVYAHTGDSTTETLTVSNTAPTDGYSEALNAYLTSISGAISTASGFTDQGTIEPGSSDTTDYSFQIDTSNTGLVSGGVTLDLVSNGDSIYDQYSNSFGTTDLGNATVTLTAEVNNYATAAIVSAGGAGSLSGDATSGYTLNLGTVAQNGGALTALLDVDNTASGQADQLSGSFVVQGDSEISEDNDSGFQGVGAGGFFGPLSVILSTATAGVFSQAVTLDLSSVNPDDSTPLNNVVVTVTGTVTAPTGALANPEITPSTTITVPNQRAGGAPELTPVSITNNATAGAQSLDAQIGGVSGAATANGVINQLAPGQTDDSSITVGVTTANGGVQTGTVTLAFQSDPSNIITPLASQTIDVVGTVYNPAAASIYQPTTQEAVYPYSTTDFIVHVNDPTADVGGLTVVNTAPNNGYSEKLVARVLGSSGSVTASGSTGLIAAGGTNTTGIDLNLVSSATAGIYHGVISVGLTTDGTGVDGLAPASIGSRVILVNGTVDNYATAGIQALGGVGTLEQSGDGYTLDFGTVAKGADVSEELGVENNATGQADALGGSFYIPTLENDPEYTNTNFGIVSGITAGQTIDNGGISLDTGTTGVFSETLTLTPYGYNASGYDGTLDDVPITVTGTVADLAIAQVNHGNLSVNLNPVREDDDVEGFIPITNIATVPAQALDGNVFSTSDDVDADGTISMVQPGSTDATGISYDIDTSDAGSKDGSVVLAFQSDDGAGTLVALPMQTFDASVDVYRLAEGEAEGSEDNTVHVGDEGVATIAVTNTADDDGYSEYLNATGTGADGDVTLDGTTANMIEAGETSHDITVTYDTSEPGEVNGQVYLDYYSDGTGLDGQGPTYIGSDNVDVSATIDNYATADVDGDADGGFGGAPGTPPDQTTDDPGTPGFYSMDLGSIEQDSGDLYGSLEALNIADGPADLLGGSWSADGDPEFYNDLGDFDGIAAGESGGGGYIDLSSSDVGVFDETVVLDAYGYNDTNYQDDIHQYITIDVEGEVTPKPPPPPPPPPQPPPPKHKTGGSGGDTHVYTYEGSRYDFQQQGEFILTKSTVNAFQVQVRIEPLSESASVSYITQVAVAVGSAAGDRVTYDPTRAVPIWVNGTPVTDFGSSGVLVLPDGTVTQDGGNFIITASTGESITVGGNNVAVSLGPNDPAGSMQGLLGNDDGNPNADLVNATGTVMPEQMSTATLYGNFGNSWRVTDADTLLDYPGGTPDTAMYTNPAFPYAPVSLSSFPTATVAAATAAAEAAGITDPGLQQSAVLDYLETNDPTYLIDASNLQQLGVTSPTDENVVSTTPSLTVGITAPFTAVTEPSTPGDKTNVTFEVYRGGIQSLAAPETVEWAVVDADTSDVSNVGTAAFSSGILPSGTVTIAANQSDTSFNVVLNNGIGTLATATLDVQITALDTAEVVAPNAMVTVINSTPEPGISPAQAAFEVVSGTGPVVQTGTASSIINLGTFVQNSAGGSGEIAIANTATMGADQLTGTLSETSDPTFTTALTPSLGDLDGGAIEDVETYAYSLAQAGTNFITITLDPVDTNVSGYTVAQPTQTLTIEDVVVPPAVATITPTSINFGDVHGGSTIGQALTISNTGSLGAENLDASIGSTGGAATGSGSFSELAQGQTDSTDIKVGLQTTSPGVQTGTVELALYSDGQGVDGLGRSALIPQAVTVTGTVYALANPSITAPGTFYTHGGLNPGLSIGIANGTSPSIYQENLDGRVTGTSGGVSTTTGSFSDVLAGGSTTLGLNLPLSSAGVVNGTVILDLVSDGSGIDSYGTTGIGTQTVAVSGTVYNYATAAIESETGGVPIAGGGTAYALDFGSVVQNTSAPLVDVAVKNTAAGPADLLSGSLSIANASSAYTDTGLSTFSGLGAGGSSSDLAISLNTGTLGVFSETITLDGTGSDPGYSGTLAPEVLTVTGTVVSQTVAPAQATLNTPGPFTLTDQRLNATPLTDKLSYTNSATPPAQNLSVSVAGSTGAAIGSGAISGLGAGTTDVTDISVGINTGTAGVRTGSVTLDDYSGGGTLVSTNTVQVSGTVYREAMASIAAPASFVTRVGGTEALAITVGNTAATDGYSEKLIANVTGSSGPLSGLPSGTGDINPGASTTLGVTVNTGTAGAIGGAVTLGLLSDGTNVDGLGTIGIGSQTIAVTGTVYREAVASVGTVAPVVLHTGQGGEAFLAIANTAPGDGFSEDLLANVLGSSAGITPAAGGTGDITPTGSTSLGLDVLSNTAGTFVGAVTLDLISDGSTIDGLGTADLGHQTVAVTGTIYNYATAAVTATGPGSFLGSDDDYTLNLGAVTQGSGLADGTLYLENTATGTADWLVGTAAASGGTANFTNTGLGAQGTLAAGMSSSGLEVAVNTGTTGTFSEVVTYTVSSTDSAGSTILTPVTVDVTGTVSAQVVPPGPAVATLNTPGPFVLANQRLNATPLTDLLSYTNSATPPAQTLSVSIASNSGAAIASGAINGLGAGTTDATDISVGINTGTAGVRTGSVTLDDYSAGTTLVSTNTIQVSGTVYREAAPSITAPSAFKTRLGSPETVSIGVANTAAADSYSEQLLANVLGASGPLSGVPSGTGDINAGGSTTLGVTVNTGTVGAITGGVTLGLLSDGTNVDGLGTIGIGTESIAVSGTVYREAAAAVTAPASFVIRQGGTEALSIGVANTAATDGYSEQLLANVLGSSGPVVAAPSSTGDINAGGASTIGVTVNTGTAGAISGGVTLGLLSDGSNVDGLGTIGLGTETIAVIGTVYREAVAHITAPLSFAIRQGGTEALSIGVANTAAADGYSEQLLANVLGSSGPIVVAPSSTGDINAGGATTLGVSVNAGTVGAISGGVTLGLLSDGTNVDGLGTIGIGTQTIAVTGTVYREAAASVTAPLSFITRVGDPEAVSIGVANTAAADGYSEQLLANVGGSSGPISVAPPSTGDINAGGSTTLGVTVNTGTAGAIAGGVTLDLFSDGSNVDGLGTIAIGMQTITVAGTVYREAVASLGTIAPIIVHAGQSKSLTLAVTNSAAADGYSEDLIANVIGSSAGITPTTARTGDIVAAGSATVGLNVLSNTAGAFSGQVTLDLLSDGTGIDGLGTADLGDQTVNITGTIYNYATAGITGSGPGVLFGSGDAYTLNLGSVTEGAALDDESLYLTNTATGPADYLMASVAASGGTSNFVDSGMGTLMALGAGQTSSPLDLAMLTGSTGTVSEVLTFTLASTDNSGSTSLTPVTIDVTGTVTAPAAGQVYTLTTGQDTVNGGGGPNTVLATTNELSTGDVINAGTSGDNTLALQGPGIFNLTLPTTLTGIQTITAQEGQPSAIVNGVGYGSQVQTVTLRAGMNNVTVDVSPGTPNPGNPAASTITITGAANNDLIELASGSDTVVMGQGETLQGGSGNDTIMVTASTIGDTINGGTGSSKLWFTGGGVVSLGGNITNIASVYLASSPSGWNFTANTIANMVVQDASTATADTLKAGGLDQTLTGGGAGKLTMIGAANDDTTFKDSAAVFNGDNIQLFTAGDLIDVTGLGFTSQGTGVGQTSLALSNGQLVVSVGGVQKTAITLAGSFIQNNFTLGSDGGTGTLIGYHS